MALTAKKVYAILKRQISDMEAKLNSPVRYRGTVATADLLPLNPDIGDMYNIESKSVYGEAGMNVAWNGVVWDTMGAPIDMSLYIKSSELADWVKQQNKPAYTAEEVGALPADTKIPSKTSDLQNDSGFLTEIPDNYLSGTDKTLSTSGKAADAKAVGDKNVELLANILSKLDKNQGSENSGKIAGINESGDIVPIFPVGVEYNSETNCLEFGSDQKMELNQGIGLDSTLTKAGYAADAGVVGEITNSLKEDISNKITKFYASSQGETHLADSDNGKIMDMMVYGKSEQKQYSGKNLFDFHQLKAKAPNITTVTTTEDAIIVSSNAQTFTGAFKIYEECDAFKGKTITISANIAKADNFDAVINFGCGLFYENAWHWRLQKVTDLGARHITVTVPETITKIQFLLNTNDNNVAKANTITVSEYMVEYGSEPTTYEPYTGGIPSPNPDYPQEIKSVVNPTVKVSSEDETESQTVTLPYTLNAIPVSSGGNVTIDGQQYIADYVDVERGKMVRMVDDVEAKNYTWILYPDANNVPRHFAVYNAIRFNMPTDTRIMSFHFKQIKYNTRTDLSVWFQLYYIVITDMNEKWKNSEALIQWFSENNVHFYLPLKTPTEIDLTPEEIKVFELLQTYYPITNISVNSEQLDGYTVFNYPISMENGWNYVKQQIGDTRDYIYDMDARTQDTDLQAAEAYVNSEYAVALTELEV